VTPLERRQRRQIERLRWELEIAMRDRREDRVMRRNAERRAMRTERHQARLERRVRWLIRVLQAERVGRRASSSRRTRRTRLQDASEILALPAHQWEAHRPGGFIR
jgi:hypothetical protein